MANTAQDIWASIPEDGASAPAAPAAPAVEQEAPTNASNKRKKSVRAVVAESLEREINASAENRDRFKKWSGALNVENSLGYSTSGSFIDNTSELITAAVTANLVTVVPFEDKETNTYVDLNAAGEIIGGVVRQKEKGNGYVSPTIRSYEGNEKKQGKAYAKKQDVPEIVGYIVKNVGTEPIQIFNDSCYKDSQGVWVQADMVPVMLQPGQMAQMTKKALTVTASQLEFSGAFANGTLVAKTKDGGKQLPIDEIIKSAHFQFGKGINMAVHDAPFKVRIDEMDDDGFFRVFPEYQEHFGFLENEGRNGKAKGRKTVVGNFDSSDFLAKMIRDSFKNA